VLGEGGGVGKSLAAVVAPVRPLPRVGAEVGGHGRAWGETLVANRAAERLLPTVGPQVSRQISGLGECLAANFTAIGLLSTVRAHVRLERGRASIAFATHLTDVASRLAWRSLGLGHRGMFSNRVNRR